MIGSHLKRLREAKGLNQKQVAKELDIPYTTYRNYENDINEPNNVTLVKLAIYFNVSADYLLDLDLENANNPPPVKDEREAIKETLMQLDDSSLLELENFIDYLIWKEEQG